MNESLAIFLVSTVMGVAGYLIGRSIERNRYTSHKIRNKMVEAGKSPVFIDTLLKQDKTLRGGGCMSQEEYRDFTSRCVRFVSHFNDVNDLKKDNG